MKKVLGIMGAFLLGFLSGAVLMNLMEIRARAVYRMSMRVALATEQEFLAARAERNGDFLRSLVHRWNAVDAVAPKGFRAFREERAAQTETNFWFPFHALILEKIRAGDRADRVGEGVQRGKLAVTLGKLGQDAAAREQWERAVELLGISPEKVRRLVEISMDHERSEGHRRAEAAVLGGDTEGGE